MVEDYYTVLGVHRKASEVEINDAYRRLIRECHPDQNPGEEAEQQFKQVQEAFEVLSDEQRRSRYNRTLISFQTVRQTGRRSPAAFRNTIRTVAGGRGNGSGKRRWFRGSSGGADQASCPSRDVLVEFSLGKIGKSRLEEITTHLHTCADCLATLSTISDADDSIMAGLRKSPVGGRLSDDQFLDEPEFREAAAQFEAAGVVPLSESPYRKRPVSELPKKLGRYELIRELGSGGMGTVYLARDSQLDRDVALKIPHFKPDENPALLKRFYREARAAATIEHPNLYPVHDVGEIDGLPYISMALVRGVPLSKLIKNRRLGNHEAAEIVRKLALAVDKAHEQGVIHRDIKPSNVMVTEAGEPILMDFGLAQHWKVADTRLTHAGTIVGTPSYMSPEQVEGEPEKIDPRSDVYSLGVVLYELLAGEAPFRGSLLSVLSQLVSDAPRRPSQCRDMVDRRLEVLCLRAMSKHPLDRYQSAEKLAGALDKYLQADLRADKPPRRWPWKIALAGAAAYLLLAGVIFFLRTREGTLVLEINQPDAKVTIDGKLVHIKSPGNEIKIKAGRHNLEVSKEGFHTVTDSFSVRRGGKVEISAKLISKYLELSMMHSAPKQYDTIDDVKILNRALSEAKATSLVPDVTAKGSPSQPGGQEKAAIPSQRKGAEQPDAIQGILTCTSLSPSSTVHNACGSVAYKGKWYLWSGYSTDVGNHRTEKLEIYDPKSDSWTYGADCPVERNGMTAFELNGKIFSIGGEGPNSAQFSREVHRYDPAADKWEKMADFPVNCCHRYGAVVNGTAYVFGGRSGYGATDSSMWQYDEAKDSWNRCASMAMSTMNGVMAVVEGKIYTIGGDHKTVESSSVPTSGMQLYDTKSNAWKMVGNCPKVFASGTGVAYDGIIYVCTPTFTDTIFCFDTARKSWSQYYFDFPDDWSTANKAVLIGNKVYFAADDQVHANIYSIELPGRDQNIFTAMNEVDEKQTSDEIHIEGNAMWNNKVYISWQNIKHVYEPDSKNMVIDTWKVDDDGDGDPRNDENRIQHNHADCANGIIVHMGKLLGHKSGASATVEKNDDGSATLTLSATNTDGDATAEYTIKPNDVDIYGTLTISPKVDADLRWVLYQIGGVWVTQGPGKVKIYDRINLNNAFHPTKEEIANRAYEWKVASKKGKHDFAALISTEKKWATGIVFLDSSVPLELVAIRVTHEYNYGHHVLMRLPEGGLTGGNTYRFSAIFHADRDTSLKGFKAICSSGRLSAGISMEGKKRETLE